MAAKLDREYYCIASANVRPEIYKTADQAIADAIDGESVYRVIESGSSRAKTMVWPTPGPTHDENI